MRNSPASGPGAVISAATSSRPSSELRSIWIERFPLLRPAQKRLLPSRLTGQRPRSRPPPMGSKRITSAPSCAIAMPPRGAATNADPSMIRMPSRIPAICPPPSRRRAPGSSSPVPAPARPSPPRTAATRPRSDARPPPPSSGSTPSTAISVRRTSPSNTGARWSQPCQARIVAIAGIARVACAAAIAIVWPPYTSRRPCELPVASVWAMAAFSVSRASSGAEVTVSPASTAKALPGDSSP